MQVEKVRYAAMLSICFPFKFEGRFADGLEVIVSGNDEESCICRLVELADNHGGLEWYSGYCDEDYENGEYIGRDNFIYE
jgi:hypothetical protein